MADGGDVIGEDRDPEGLLAAVAAAVTSAATDESASVVVTVHLGTGHELSFAGQPACPVTASVLRSIADTLDRNAAALDALAGLDFTTPDEETT